MTTPKLGVLIHEEKALSAAREADPVSLVVLRSTLVNPPRAAAARALAERVRALHPDAAIVPYAWHLVTHGPEDGSARARHARAAGRAAALRAPAGHARGR